MNAGLELAAVTPDTALKERVFGALRRAILDMDIYARDTPPRLDERQLAESLGVSRTPVREALSRLEQEGLVRNVPRRGMFVVRKSKREIVEIIEVWAALESMAARLATRTADDASLEAFRRRSAVHGGRGGEGGKGGRGGKGSQGGKSCRGGKGRQGGKGGKGGQGGQGDQGSESGQGGDRDGSGSSDGTDLPIDEYSEGNIAFHQDIIALSGNDFLVATARRSFDHMHAIRASTIRDPARTLQSVIDHRLIVEALLERRAARAERLVRDHALNLARHVERNVDFLE